MFKKNIFAAAILFAAVFLFSNLANSQTLLLLNSGRDYCYIYSVNQKKILAKYKVCEKKASCTDIVPLKKGFLVIPHRLNINVDATELYVYNSDFSKIIKKIPVEKSPYKAFVFGENKALINHTFFSFERMKFVAEIVNLNTLKIEKIMYFDGIPAGIIKLFGDYYAVIEDVRGVVKGTKLVNLKTEEFFLVNNPYLSSNVVALNDILYCAVNDYGEKDYANALFEIVPSMLSKVYSSVKKVYQFKNPKFPYILGLAGNFIVIGFTNHSIKSNFNKICLFDTKNKETFFLQSCFGPECMAVSKDKIFVAGLSSECITEISVSEKKSKIIKISDTIPGFSSIRIIKD